MKSIKSFVYVQEESWRAPFDEELCAAKTRFDDQCSRPPKEKLGSYRFCKAHANMIRRETGR